MILSRHLVVTECVINVLMRGGRDQGMSHHSLCLESLALKIIG